MLLFSEFKSKMKAANAVCESKLMKGAIHGFFSLPGKSTFLRQIIFSSCKWFLFFHQSQPRKFSRFNFLVKFSYESVMKLVNEMMKVLVLGGKKEVFMFVTPKMAQFQLWNSLLCPWAQFWATTT